MCLVLSGYLEYENRENENRNEVAGDSHFWCSKSLSKTTPRNGDDPISKALDPNRCS